MIARSCECEHAAHGGPDFPAQTHTPHGNPGHDYGAKFYTLFPVKTDYGTFRVCQDCKTDCHRGEGR